MRRLICLVAVIALLMVAVAALGAGGKKKAELTVKGKVATGIVEKDGVKSFTVTRKNKDTGLQETVTIVVTEGDTATKYFDGDGNPATADQVVKVKSRVTIKLSAALDENLKGTALEVHLVPKA